MHKLDIKLGTSPATNHTPLLTWESRFNFKAYPSERGHSFISSSLILYPYRSTLEWLPGIDSGLAGDPRPSGQASVVPPARRRLRAGNRSLERKDLVWVRVGRGGTGRFDQSPFRLMIRL